MAKNCCIGSFQPNPGADVPTGKEPSIENSQIYIVGGEQRDNAKDPNEWHSHRAGSILRLDPTSKAVEKILEYKSPAEVCPDKEPSICFKSSTVHHGQLYTCTSTEILIYDLPSMTLKKHISHPCFNDIHHVNVDSDGCIYVANTGLDQVLKLSPEGDIKETWSTLEDCEPWSRFSPDIDYRKVPTTKPHKAHPNYVFFIEDDVWVTRFNQKDALCLTSPGKRFQVSSAEAKIHDGNVCDSGIYFTQVDAHLIRVNRQSLQVEETIDLAPMMPGVRKPAWTRSLHVIDQDRVIVGFSRLRPSLWPNNLSWLKMEKLKRYYRSPARICLFNLRDRCVEWDIPLQKLGMTTVFSIHQLP